MMRRFLVGILFAACKKDDPGPPCAQVVDHILDVSKQGLTGHGTLELGNRKLMIEHCETRKLSADARRCIVAAKDLAGLAECNKLEPPPPTPGPVDIPAGSGTGTR
jgi:hypothetical protein